MTQTQDFGLLLRDVRKQTGLTQTELALEIGATQMAVSYWESGKTLPSRGYMSELCRSFPEHEDELLRTWAYAKLEVVD